MRAREVGRRVLLALAVCVLVVLSAGPAAASGWTWPLGDGAAPALGRRFDPPQTRYGAGHRGVDLLGVPGEQVHAAGSGLVTWAGLIAGRGVVVVQSGALRTTYEPVTPSVAIGALVLGGQVLGTLDAGHDGCPVPACLHWGLRRGDAYLDPLSLVGRGPVRLLPVTGGEALAAPTDPAESSPRPAARAEDPATTVRPSSPAVVAPAADRRWSLRDAAEATGAVVALGAGLALVASGRRRPDPPPSVPTAGGSPGPARPGPPPEAAPLAVVDLAVERLRRAG